jgi:ADP-ribose pyrophosphatase YjhB (NUDIX family)
LEIIKTKSLGQLAMQLGRIAYPGYPEHQDRYFSDMGRDFLEKGAPWMTEDLSEMDAKHLALHPWFDDMAGNRQIGVLAGKGFYWSWGPNYTADPIIIRNDLDEPHLLLIKRSDTGQLALPGGFVDKDEDPVDAAIREAGEEANIDLRGVEPHITYQGPVADIRTTGHAWAETTAVRFDITNEKAIDLPFGPYKGGDDALEALWVPKFERGDALFGSHRILVDDALEK